MKTLSEIRRSLISFYSAIQNRITDFSIGSVAGGLMYSFSASLESVYADLEEIKRQSYIATATGEYLDKLIFGTFQFPRRPATRATGYVVVYANSPITNPATLELRYADYDHNAGEFTAGVQESTKFVGYNLQGEEGVVFSLIAPRNTSVLLPSVSPGETERLIYINRPIQFLILPVASLIRGSGANIREGGINSFPSPPPGLSGVINTRNPEAVFFASNQAVVGAPFFSRFTEIVGYNNQTSSFAVTNAFNFSRRGFVEIMGDPTDQHRIVATYTNDTGTVARNYGLVFEYIDASISNITLSHPIDNALGRLPTVRVVENNVLVDLVLRSFTYRNNTYTNLTPLSIRQFVESHIPSGLRIQQRPEQIVSDLIFDPDGVLTATYRLSDAAVVGGASDADTDAEYRQALTKYLAGLARATNRAIEAGALTVPGVAFAKVLSPAMSPRGSSILLASDEGGFLSPELRHAIRMEVGNDWQAAGINVIIQSPTLIPTQATMAVKLDPGTSQAPVTQQINLVMERYLRERIPGDSIRYSDILDIVSSVGGVLNIFNLILTRSLTEDTYRRHRAAYDEVVIIKASTSGIIIINEGITVSPGSLIHYNPADSTYVLPSADFPANALVYTRSVGVSGQPTVLEILLGNVSILGGIYNELIAQPIVGVEHFRNVILRYREMFISELDMIYFLSYVLAEPLEELPPENYPININTIDYRHIRDYTARATEIFRLNKITVDTRTLALVGIKYL